MELCPSPSPRDPPREGKRSPQGLVEPPYLPTPSPPPTPAPLPLLSPAAANSWPDSTLYTTDNLEPFPPVSDLDFLFSAFPISHLVFQALYHPPSDIFIYSTENVIESLVMWQGLF